MAAATLVPLADREHGTIYLQDGKTPASRATARVFTRRKGELVELPVWADAEKSRRLAQPLTAGRDGRLPGLVSKRHHFEIEATWRGRTISTTDLEAAVQRAEADRDAEREAHAQREADRQDRLHEQKRRDAQAATVARERETERDRARELRMAARAAAETRAAEKLRGRQEGLVDEPQVLVLPRGVAQDLPRGTALTIELKDAEADPKVSISEPDFEPVLDSDQDADVLNVTPGFGVEEDDNPYYDPRGPSPGERALMAPAKDPMLITPATRLRVITASRGALNQIPVADGTGDYDWADIGTLGVLASQVGPRLIAINPLGGGQDDAPQINAYLGALANAEFTLDNWAKSVSYLGSQHFTLLSPVICNTKFISLLADGSVLDCRNMLNNSITMTLALTHGSSTATIVATSNSGWIPVQNCQVQGTGITAGTYIITGTGFTPGGLFSPSTQGHVGSQFQLSTTFGGTTGNVSVTILFGAALIFTGSADIQDGAQSWGDAVQTVEKLQLIGPAPQGGATAMQSIIDTPSKQFAGIQMGAANLVTGNAGAAHKALKNLTIRGFWTGVLYSNSAYLDSFEGCDIFDNVFGINVPFAGSNFGESIKFVDCAIFGNGMDVLCGGVGADVRFIGGSMDYLTQGLTMPFGLHQCKIYQTKGRVYCESVHYEDTYDSWYWFAVTDPSCAQKHHHCDLQPAANKSSYEFGWCPQIPGSTSVYYSGMEFDSCHLVGTPTAYSLPTLIAGRGRTDVRKLTMEAGFVSHTYNGGQDLDPYAQGTGILSSVPYAPYSRYQSVVDGSFGIQSQNIQATSVGGGSPSPTITLTQTMAFMPSIGAVVTNPPGSNVFPGGTTVLSVSGTGAIGDTITLSNNAALSVTAGTFVFDSTTQSTAAALGQFSLSGSTATADQPTIDTTTRATNSSDGIIFNSLKLAVGTNGHNTMADLYVPVSPGQIINWFSKLKTQNLVANSNTFSVLIDFLDRNGNPVNRGAYAEHISTNVSTDLGSFGGSPQYPLKVPKNVSLVRWRFQGINWQTSTAAWVSDLIINLDGGAGQSPQPVFGDLVGSALFPTVKSVLGGNNPQYELASATPVTSGQSGIGTGATDITGLTVTFNFPPSGIALVEAELLSIQQVASPGSPAISITDSSNVEKNRATTSPLTAAQFSGTIICKARVTGTPGASATYKVRGFTTAGTMSTVAGATFPATFRATAI